MSTAEARAVRIARDILSMLTGSAGMLWQLYTNQLTFLGVIACLILLGVPLVNLRTLLPNGTADTPPSLPPPPAQPSSPGQSSPPSRQQPGTDE